jgi:WD40 repeat protein
MGVEEFYTENHLEKELPDSLIPAKKVSKFVQCQGIQSYKRYNLSFLDEKHVIYITGNTYNILNIESRETRVFFGHDTDGIGSIAVHPNQTHFAVAEKGEWPCIYIYEYPSLKLYRIMRRGTEKAYSHCEFSKNGDMLASVGSDPDYTLTVWNWMS